MDRAGKTIKLLGQFVELSCNKVLKWLRNYQNQFIPLRLLPEPIYTPATKAEFGEHDENISYEETINLIGEELASKVRDTAIEIYNFGVNHAKERGIIIADTKFEFGLDNDGNLFLIDEVLTPDSSRFWSIEEYKVGISPPSFDKQYLRDYLETLDWDKTAPGPELPEDVIANTTEKYRSAYRTITQGEG